MLQFSYLIDVITILTAAILFVLLVRSLRISSVIGYLAAGAVIGPFGALLVKNQETIHLLADFGIVFLLFSVGLELPFQRLLSMRWHIFGLGLAQVFFTSLVIGLGCYYLGFSAPAALIIGGALALSSTATVLQLLTERGEIAAKFGRIAIAILIFQDLAVVPLLVLIPMLKTAHGMNVFAALAFGGMKGVLVLLLIAILGRFVVRPLFGIMAHLNLPEIFTATTLLIVLCAALLTAVSGMSMALGAFLAGLLLAETKYRHQVEADIQPFRGLFLGLFFMSVGMSMDIHYVLTQIDIVLGLTILLFIIKVLLLIVLCILFKQSQSVSVRAGFMLSQHSEFGFVLFALTVHEGLLSATEGQLFTAVITLSILLTPFSSFIGKKFSDRLNTKSNIKQYDISHESEDISEHVIIAGYGRVGQIIGKLLALYKIPYIALETNTAILQEIRHQHQPIFYGDARRLETLKSAGIERANALAITLDNPRDAEKLVTLLREHYPTLKIITRAYDHEHKKRLELLGVTSVVPEITEPSLLLSTSLLEQLGMPKDEIERLLSKCRQNNYALLDGLFTSSSALSD